MKIRTFEFTPDQSGRTDFRLAYEAFRARDPQKCVNEERQYLAQAQRALEAISDPVGDLAQDADLDGRFRKLQADGGKITITQRLHEKIDKWVEECLYQAGVSMQVEDFRDRWGQAEKGDREDVPEPVPAGESTARPRRVKAS